MTIFSFVIKYTHFNAHHSLMCKHTSHTVYTTKLHSTQVCESGRILCVITSALNGDVLIIAS